MRINNKINLLNYNLSQIEFNAISSSIGNEWVGIDDDMTMLFIKLQNLNRDSRMLLRKAIHKNTTAHIVLLSTNNLIAKFAWKIQAFHYLSYPITSSQLGILKLKIKQNFINRKDSEKLKMTFKGGFHMIHPRDITVIQGQGNYCNFYLKETAPVLYTARIGEIFQKIKDFPYIKKINKSLIININHLSQIKSGNAYFIGKPSVKLQLSERSLIIIKKELLWLD